jgi:hypothetical protein
MTPILAQPRGLAMICQQVHPRTWFLRTDALGEVALSLDVLAVLGERPRACHLTRIESRRSAA